MDEFALKLIRTALSTPKSRQQLLEITKLPERTLRYNLSILKKQDIVKEIILFSDLRKKMFSLTNKGGDIDD